MPIVLEAWRIEGGNVVDVQYGTIDLGTGTSNTATITSVDTTKSSVLHLGVSTTTDLDPNSASVRLTLTNATTVTGTREGSAAGVIVGFAVVTWDAPLNVQQSTIAIGSGDASNTATITSVDTAKSIAFWLGETAPPSTDSTDTFSRVTLTNATTVTATRGGTPANTVTVGFVVVSF